MCELYVMRHGETEWNVQKRYQGQLNSPLTSEGRETARRQGGRLEPISFEAVYCSPLGRCRETLELAAPKGAAPRFDDRLQEFCLGVLQGKTHDQVAPEHREQQALFWENPAAFALEEAETFPALERRVRSILAEAALYEGPVLFLTHTVIIKMLQKVILDNPLERLWDDPYLFPGTILRFVPEGERLVPAEVLHPEGAGKPVRAYTA